MDSIRGQRSPRRLAIAAAAVLAIALGVYAITHQLGVLFSTTLAAGLFGLGSSVAWGVELQTKQRERACTYLMNALRGSTGPALRAYVEESVRFRHER